MAYKFSISQGEEVLLKAASIGAALLGVVAVYSFYKNNIWKPDIKVKDVDFKKGVANLEINGKPFVLRGDSSYLISFDWGVRFGFTPTPEGKRVYDRIEVLKRNMVQKVIRKADEKEMSGFTGFDEKTFWNDAFEGGKGALTAQVRSFTGSEKAIVDDVWGVKDGEGFSIFVNK
jgi:hypothetical protein